MHKLAMEAQNDPQIRELSERVVAGLVPHDYVSEYAALLNWVRRHIRYSRDPATIEQLKTPRALLETRTGDCFTADTSVILRDREGFYRVRQLGELEHSWQEYEALSYNFSTNEWEFKPILDWGLRGVRPVVDVRLRNGYTFTCTPDHPVYSWGRNGVEQVAVGSLGENLTVLCAKQIPSLEVPLEGFAENSAAWLAGAYTAEGWSCDHPKVCIARSGPSQRDLRECLDRLGVAHSVSKRTKSAYVTILKQSNAWKQRLRMFGSRALNKHIYEELLSAPRPILEAWLQGYAWGDSWVPGEGPRKSHQGHVAMHSTISRQLAADLKVLYLILGRPLNGSLVEKHGGLGKNPIWRLWESRGDRYRERLPGLTNQGVKVAEAGEAPVYDITVADNHNFVLSNGALVHNCDDMATLLAAMVGHLGGRSRFVAGAFKRYRGRPILSHVWVEAHDPASNAWIALDPVPGRAVHKMLGKTVHRIQYRGVG